jgi:hypothetical protein
MRRRRYGLLRSKIVSTPRGRGERRIIKKKLEAEMVVWNFDMMHIEVLDNYNHLPTVRYGGRWMLERRRVDFSPRPRKHP